MGHRAEHGDDTLKGGDDGLKCDDTLPGDDTPRGGDEPQKADARLSGDDLLRGRGRLFPAASSIVHRSSLQWPILRCYVGVDMNRLSIDDSSFAGFPR